MYFKKYYGYVNETGKPNAKAEHTYIIHDAVVFVLFVDVTVLFVHVVVGIVSVDRGRPIRRRYSLLRTSLRRRRRLSVDHFLPRFDWRSGLALRLCVAVITG